MTFNIAEYNSLRAELIHHDRTCLTIIGLLLTASTTIYGLVLKGNSKFLLIILSVIWFVGFIYIVEKRFTIKRISYYICTHFEKDESFNWEGWSRSNRSEEITSEDSQTIPKLTSISPISIELTLLIVTEVFNACMLCLPENILKNMNNYFLNSQFFVCLFVLSFACAFIGKSWLHFSKYNLFNESKFTLPPIEDNNVGESSN